MCVFLGGGTVTPSSSFFQWYRSSHVRVQIGREFMRLINLIVRNNLLTNKSAGAAHGRRLANLWCKKYFCVQWFCFWKILVRRISFCDTFIYDRRYSIFNFVPVWSHRAGARLDNKILGGLLEGESVDELKFQIFKHWIMKRIVGTSQWASLSENNSW